MIALDKQLSRDCILLHCRSLPTGLDFQMVRSDWLSPAAGCLLQEDLDRPVTTNIRFSKRLAAKSWSVLIKARRRSR